jgi:regulatory protein
VTRPRDRRDQAPADLTRAEDVGASRPVDNASLARSIGLRLLTGAPRSRAELATAMAAKGVPDDVAGAVLDRFTEVGLLDDAEYARMLVRSRHAAKGLAHRALRLELRRKGIDDDVAAEALSTLDPDQEQLTARALARRRLASSGELSRDVRTRRVVAMLARKGYPPGFALQIVREILDEESAAAAPSWAAGGADRASSDDGWFLSGD